MQSLPRVCIIGAGSSGLPMVKALHDRGIPFDCYEASDRVGGNWVFGNANGVSSAYRSLHINTSRDRMEYGDFPMPPSYPDFPHHSLIAAYFDDYVDHFNLRHTITFETKVVAARRQPDGVWLVELDSGQTRRYDALAVANGHHWDPRWPDPPFPGSFDGIELHSHDYIDPRTPHDLVDARVVVLGMGNSAVDIACELSQRGVAATVFHAARRSAHIVPHYIFGKPMDQLLTLPPWLPQSLRQPAARLIHRVAVGDMRRWGLPAPDHKLGQAHPTISSEFLPRLGRGDIIAKSNISHLDGQTVHFTDGSAEAADAIIYCTGYNVTFPFFDPDFLAAPNNDLPLFRRVFEPSLDNLFFIGLLQPLGAIMPLAEAQSKWVADYLCGDYCLPTRAEMRAEMARDRLRMFRRYIKSARHTMQVDYDDYLYALTKERRAGARRASRRGHTLPLAARSEQRRSGAPAPT